MTEKKFVAHGEIESDGTLTIRGLNADKFVITKNVKSFDVWFITDGWESKVTIDTSAEEEKESPKK